MGVETAEHGGSRGTAYGLTDVGVFEYVAFVCKGVEIRGVDVVVAITTHGVGALLVGEDEEEVGFHSLALWKMTSIVANCKWVLSRNQCQLNTFTVQMSTAIVTWG